MAETPIPGSLFFQYSLLKEEAIRRAEHAIATINVPEVGGQDAETRRINTLRHRFAREVAQKVYWKPAVCGWSKLVFRGEEMLRLPPGIAAGSLLPDSHLWVEFAVPVSFPLTAIDSCFFHYAGREQDIDDMGANGMLNTSRQHRFREMASANTTMWILELSFQGIPVLDFHTAQTSLGLQWFFSPIAPCPYSDPYCNHTVHGFKKLCSGCQDVLDWVRQFIPLLIAPLRGYEPRIDCMEKQVTHYKQNPLKGKTALTYSYLEVDQADIIAPQKVGQHINAEVPFAENDLQEKLFEEARTALLRCGSWAPTLYIEDTKGRLHTHVLEGDPDVTTLERVEQIGKHYRQQHGVFRSLSFVSEAWTSHKEDENDTGLPVDDPNRGECFSMHSVNLRDLTSQSTLRELLKGIHFKNYTMIRDVAGVLIDLQLERREGVRARLEDDSQIIRHFIKGHLGEKGLAEAQKTYIPPTSLDDPIFASQQASAPSTEPPKNIPVKVLPPDKKPFIEKLLASMRTTLEQNLSILRKQWKDERETAERIHILETLYRARVESLIEAIERARKYRFDVSASQMVEALRPWKDYEVLMLQRLRALSQETLTKTFELPLGEEKEWKHLGDLLADRLKKWEPEIDAQVKKRGRKVPKLSPEIIDPSTLLPVVLTLPPTGIWIENVREIGLPIPLPGEEESEETKRLWGSVRGFYFGCPAQTLRTYLDQHVTDPGLQAQIIKNVALSQEKWSLLLFNDRYEVVTLYVYYPTEQRWGFHHEHLEACPLDLCEHIPVPDELTAEEEEKQEHLHDKDKPCIIPCPLCLPQLTFVSSWFTTALLMVQGVFAHEDDEELPAEHPAVIERSTRKVKRPGSGKYDEIAHDNLFYFVTFDPTRPRKRKPQIERDPSTVVSRGSWIVEALAKDPLGVVDVTLTDLEFTRTYHNERYVNVRGLTQVVHVPKKRVPMLRANLQRRIEQVTIRPHKKAE